MQEAYFVRVILQTIARLCLVIWLIPSIADTCVRPTNFCEGYNNSAEVFLGRLIKVNKGRGNWEYRFRVKESFKGKLTSEVVASVLVDSSVTCLLGPILVEKKDYVVYIWKTDSGQRLIIDERGITTKLAEMADSEIRILRANAGKQNIKLELCQSQTK